MNRNRHFIPTSANKINANSALPDFLQKTSEDSNSKTWREIAVVHGVVNYDKGSAFRPLIKPKAQNGFVYRGGDDDLTMEQAMKKGIAPPGMKPAWSPEARKKYVACVTPKIEKYKKVVDRNFSNAETAYNNDVFGYISTTFSIGSLAGLFSASKSDVPIGFQARTETPPKRFLGNPNRVIFWVSFTFATTVYLRQRVVASRKEANEFMDATDSFFEDVTECREKNPYDMWILLTPGEIMTKEFIKSLTHPPDRKTFLNL